MCGTRQLWRRWRHPALHVIPLLRRCSLRTGAADMQAITRPIGPQVRQAVCCPWRLQKRGQALAKSIWPGPARPTNGEPYPILSHRTL